jgi:acyl carrier protein
MNNHEKYNQAFIELFNLKKEELGEALFYQSVDAWDSVGHMELIAKLESEFNIMVEMDDVIDFSSYEKGMLILQKYKVIFD